MLGGKFMRSLCRTVSSGLKNQRTVESVNFYQQSVRCSSHYHVDDDLFQLTDEQKHVSQSV